MVYDSALPTFIDLSVWIISLQYLDIFGLRTRGSNLSAACQSGWRPASVRSNFRTTRICTARCRKLSHSVNHSLENSSLFSKDWKKKLISSLALAIKFNDLQWLDQLEASPHRFSHFSHVFWHFWCFSPAPATASPALRWHLPKT